MFSRHVSRLRQLSTQRTQLHRASASSPVVDDASPRSQDPLNADRAIRQRRREGHEETLRHASLEQAKTAASQRHAEAARDTALHEIAIRAVVADHEAELQASARMRQDGLDEFLQHEDVIQAISRYADHGIADAQELRDEDLKARTIKELRFAATRAMTMQRLTVYGGVHDRDVISRSEELL